MKVELIDYMGDDLRVANAARVSFDKESKDFTYREDLPKGSDQGLLEYLGGHNHWTPFAHCIITMRETVPIFVARQRFKHTVGWAYNEVSRRYVDSEPEFFIPKEWRSKPTNGAKQGSSEPLEPIIQGFIESEYEAFLEDAKWLYNTMIDNDVCPEQARIVLPQSMYTSYYVTGSLYAWANAYNQRIDKHAQQEIQEVAQQWDAILRELYPEAWKVLTKGE